MTWCIVVELAGTPRGKGRPRATVTKQGFAQVYTDEKTRKYESQLRFAAQQQMMDQPPSADPISVSVDVRLVVPESWSQKKKTSALLGPVRPTGKGSGDVDNFLKCLDALNGVVWADDAQIVEAHVRKRYSQSPGLTVTIASIEQPALAPATVIAGRQALFAFVDPAERLAQRAQ